jgi:NADH dehydrogenase [ubiquinone] 1 alpha subcomplex assembly factor 6
LVEQSGEAEPLARRCRRVDYDRYLMAGFAPLEARPAMLALIAFNYEIGRVRDVVSEPMLGQIRLQWWREAMDGIYAGTPRSHDVVLALNDAISVHSLSREHFDTMIDTREQDLDDTPPDDLPALMRYVAGTAGALNQLILEVTQREDAALRHAAAELGAAWGLVGLLRAIPSHAAQGRVLLPATLLADAGLSSSDVLSKKGRDCVRPVVVAIACEAAKIVGEPGSGSRKLPEQARAPFLAAPLARYYLGRLSAADHNPWDKRVSGNPLGRLRALGMARLRGRY